MEENNNNSNRAVWCCPVCRLIGRGYTQMCPHISLHVEDTEDASTYVLSKQ